MSRSLGNPTPPTLLSHPTHPTQLKQLMSIALVLILTSLVAQAQEVDPEYTLNCHRRPYTYRVTQTDSQGRTCAGEVMVMSCWGRCDSNEVSDWRFPYKRSYHPVCIHGDREPRVALLQDCAEDAEPGTELHEYMEAMSCKCSLCRSSEASCEGLRYRGQRGELGWQRG